MNEKQLMIDDLVYTPFKTLMSIPRQKIYKVDVQLLSNSRALKDVSPIPITLDILKIIGFEIIVTDEYSNANLLLNNNCHIWFQFINGHINLGISISDIKHPYEFHGTIQYIHEFQHILRSCKLNKFANELKIYY